MQPTPGCDGHIPRSRIAPRRLQDRRRVPVNGGAAQVQFPCRSGKISTPAGFQSGPAGEIRGPAGFRSGLARFQSIADGKSGPPAHGRGDAAEILSMGARKWRAAGDERGRPSGKRNAPGWKGSGPGGGAGLGQSVNSALSYEPWSPSFGALAAFAFALPADSATIRPCRSHCH